MRTGNKTIAVSRIFACARSGLEEDIGFVNEHNGFPIGGVPLELEHILLEAVIIFELA